MSFVGSFSTKVVSELYDTLSSKEMGSWIHTYIHIQWDCELINSLLWVGEIPGTHCLES